MWGGGGPIRGTHAAFNIGVSAWFINAFVLAAIGILELIGLDLNVGMKKCMPVNTSRALFRQELTTNKDSSESFEYFSVSELRGYVVNFI